MKIVLHALETDADGEQATLCLQLGEAEPVTYRVRTEMEGNAMRVGSSDGSGAFEELARQLCEIAKAENLPRSTNYLGHLLSIIHDQRGDKNRYDYPLYFPILIDWSRLYPHETSPWKRRWSRLVQKITPRRPFSP